MTGGAAGRNQRALQARLVRLAPVDLEGVPAAVTPHRGGMFLQLLAFAGTRAHGVAVSPARGQALGLILARHRRPPARARLAALEGCPQDLSPLPSHLD